MSRTLRLVLGLCLLVSLSSFVAASVNSDPAKTTRLAVGAFDGTVVPVPNWDPDSVQQLVRLDGALYQEDAGFYYPVIADRLTIRLNEDVKSWDDLLAKARDTTLDEAAYAALASLHPVRRNALAILDLATPAHGDLPALAALLFRSGLVRYAELSTLGSWTLVPNDTRYDEQWALNNTGQTGGSAGADIRAEEAWNLTTGDASTIVAVIDSGTDVDHEDLAANVWHNAGETPNNGIDDDANGYIDDWEGWDFDNDNNDPRSTYFHGTHVTGIVNGATNNGIGIAGLAGGNNGNGVAGMALGVGESGPNGNVLDDAIIYAADNGAAVITLSLSVGETQAINDALDYAYNTKDVFIDCASGNNGSSVGYPARRPEIMAVAASDHNDNKSGFSNPGPEVEVAAPGTDILSTQIGDAYGTSSGTSFAAPYVAGLAGLMRTRNPGLPAAELRQLIMDSSDDIGPAGFDEGTGHGRINAFEAVSLAANSNGVVRLDRAAYSCADQLKITVSDIDLAGALTTDVTLSSDTESEGEIITLSETGTSSGVFRATVATAAGAPASDGVLQVSDQDEIRVVYVDADDGEGGTNVSKTDTAQADCRSPLLSNIREEEITNVSATIRWTSDEASTSLVRFDPFTPPGSEESRPGLVTDHSVPLTLLSECTVYKYEVESADALGNLKIDDNGGLYYSFETYGEFPGLGIMPCHRGAVQLDKADYACSDVVTATVTDLDLNTDSGVVETVQVLLTSTTEPDGEWIVLSELDANNSRFEGTIPLGSEAIAGDGVLGVSPADLITATYYDEDDGDGQRHTSTDTSHADCVAPSIGDLQVVDIRNNRATLEWTTDEPATSRVDYGSSPELGLSVEDTDLVTSHQLTLRDFASCERVYFRVSSADAQGDLRVADADGAPFAFNLDQIGGLLFYDDFESESGWDLDPEWERGAPEGLGSGSGDPLAAYGGTGVIGTDLSGQGVHLGDYEDDVTISAASPTIDASAASNLELIYRRKLGVSSSDEASVHALTVGLTSIWTSGGSVNDGSWVETRHDISSQADGRPSLRIVYRIESDASGVSFGWNLDELIIKDATQPDYESCGGCAGAPAFAGLRTLYDDAPCASGGLTLEWDPASAWGTGSSGSYEVYRGESADFLPEASNQVASGLSGTSWTDANAPVNTSLWYLVRARNNESCSGSGLPDSNLVRLEGRETITRPPAGSPGQSLELRAVGDAHARLSWSATQDTDHYLVRRSESPDFSSPIDLGSSTDPLLEDENALTNAKNYFYRLVAVNPCGDETP